jgi:hypothetical protein
VGEEALTMNDVVVELLQEAKERIAAGWCQLALQKVYPDGTVEVCALGAFRRQDGQFYKALEALHATLNCRRNHGSRHCASMSVVDHNNLCLRSQVEALDWFERAIRYAKEVH